LVDKVVNAGAPSLSLDQSDGLEHPQVLGNSGLRYSQQTSQGIDAEGIGLTLMTEEPYQFETGRISEGAEYRRLLIRPLFGCLLGSFISIH
jgi:hypothetical protein